MNGDGYTECCEQRIPPSDKEGEYEDDEQQTEKQIRFENTQSLFETHRRVVNDC